VASTVRSRRRVTSVAVPGAMAVLMAGAFAAAPALAAAGSTPTLPFPTVCASGQSASGSPSASPTTGSPSATASAAAKAKAAVKTTTPGTTSPATKPAAPTTSGTGEATPTPSASGTGTGSASASASPSASSTASGSTGGFWGWLNGVWTWIFGDDATNSTKSDEILSAAQPITDTTHAASSPSPSVTASRSTPVSASGTTAAASPSPAASSARADKPTSSEPSATTSPNCISAASEAALAKAAGDDTSEGVYAVTTPWVMETPEMTLTGLTFNGVDTVSVWNATEQKYVDEQVLDFTASTLTIESMVTYSIQSAGTSGSYNTVYNNAGSGTVTTLTDVHLLTVSLTASLYGLIPQKYTPTSLPPLPEHLDLGFIPVVFTGVTTQLAYLNTASITVPGFQGFAQSGAASPE
jgi:hypothetical protein